MSRQKGFIAGLFFFAMAWNAGAQFYNGHQMTFGKNRVQYGDFFWNFYRFDRYDIYFNQFGTELAQYAAKYAGEQLPAIESFFDYTIDKRLIFLVYNKLADFRQGNIGLVTGNDELNNLGGVTRIVNNKVSIFFDGNHRHFEEQIRSAIAEVMLNEMLYGSDLRENITNTTLINLPEWYRSGLISYLGREWSIEIDNIVRDGILSGRYKRFNRLEGADALYAGHSFWKFIADRYGKSVIPNIVYLTRINKNASTAFLNVLGFTVRDLAQEWLLYYQDQYYHTQDVPAQPETGKIIRHPRKKLMYYQVKINPASNYIAWVTNLNGKYKIWLYNEKTGKKRCIFRKEHQLDQIQDYSYPVLGWNPTGQILSFFTEEKGGIRFYQYNIATKELIGRNFLYFEKVLDFGYSPDGLQLVLSAIQKGKSDIYVHTLASATSEQITNDLADDFHPRFIQGGKQILFSSNRTSDSLTVMTGCDQCTKATFDLYLALYPQISDVLTNLSETAYTDNIQPAERGRNEFMYLSDKSGIFNRYLGRFDSTISFVDTIIHYRYFSKSVPLTNYSRGILEHDYSPGTSKIADLIFSNGRFNIFSHEAEVPGSASPPVSTPYRAILTAQLRKNDSIARIPKTYIPLQMLGSTEGLPKMLDSTLNTTKQVDINNYIFEEEKINYLNAQLAKQNIVITRDSANAGSLWPRVRIYETSFYTNYIVNQIDFTFLNASYQAFTGGAVYYNPGFNMLFKLGTNDLFEDYKIIGGVRFATDFDSNEYLLSFENLKKRLDKQVVFHRQVFKNYLYDYDYLIKTQTHQVMYILRYPFSQVFAVKGTASFRHDRTVLLATDVKSLELPNYIRAWAGLKGELIFDNTRSLGINLYSGTRYKIFGEYYKQVNEKKTDLWVLGIDFRHYVRIHRSLIWATRFAASTSFGHARLIYYLGSVDNWINLFPGKYPTFDQSVAVDPKVNYAYQTLATDMRGFTQNIRNGNNFALINNEIRFPVFRYILNRPLSSAFLNNFQVVGFADVGSAWTGFSPYSGKNAYDREVIDRGTYKIILQSNRDPIVAGYGFGLRTQILGYFLRLDWAHGIENKVILPRIFYLSLNLDF